ncbi:MAG: cyclic nucleotide-binding domain-containing protein [Desulfobacterales bacterium]|nr:cyclic nucleotide-binding domain-containing protein [Desulfobacterales bacterium]
MHHLDAEELKNLKIFRDLLPDEWTEVYALLNRQKIIEGEQLIREGEQAHTFFIILRGHFMIHYGDGRAVTLNKKGDIIGWSSVIRPFQYTANVTALTAGEVLSIPGDRFLELLQKNAELGDKLVKRVNELVSKRQAID